MPRRNSLRICTVPGCPEYTTQGRCDDHRREAEQRRGTSRQRGYGGPRWQAARRQVLTRDPRCVCPDTSHGHADPCGQPSSVADHHPDERRDLITQGVTDPDAPHRMRGMCVPCHNRKSGTTAQAMRP